jgi:Ca2+-binding EF-hand superfamily protein
LYDLNKNDQISFRELILGIGYQRKVREEHELRAHFEKLFHILDTNKDSKISPAELANFVEALIDYLNIPESMLNPEQSRKAIESSVNELFQLYDLEKTGLLSKTEFVNLCLNSNYDLFI